MGIKYFCLICLMTIITSCATFNISATDNNVTVDNRDVSKSRSFESIIETSKESIVLLSSSPYEDPTIDTSKNAVCTGVIIDEKGHILTNYHCVHNQKYIKLYYYSAEDIDEYMVETIGTDPLADLALLRVIDYEGKLPHLNFAENTGDLQSGAEVFTLGHPMGMAWSVTKGIISNNERFARHPYIHAIQTDASINKGNSGGPLMNMQGEIIGINTAIISHIGQSAGVGLAIRGDIVKKSLESMLEIGTVIRPAIGVHIMPLGHPRQRKLVVKEYPKLKDSHIPNVSGMFVSEPSGTELPEGVKKFDTIIAIDGKPFNNGIEFSDILSEHEVGDEVILTIIRKRRYILVKVELKELPIDVEKMYPSNVTMIPNDKNNEK